MIYVDELLFRDVTGYAVEDGYLELPLDLEKEVILVDSKKNLAEAVETLFSGSSSEGEDCGSSEPVLIGLDTEWRPTFGSSKEKYTLLFRSVN